MNIKSYQFKRISAFFSLAMFGCFANLECIAQSFTYTSGTTVAASVQTDDLLQTSLGRRTQSGTFNNEGTVGISAINDGIANNGTSNNAAISNNAVVTYYLDILDNSNGYTLTELGINTGWQDNGRINPNVTVSYSTVANPESFTILGTASFSSPGGSRWVKSVYTPVGGTLTGVAAIRFNFGTQQNGHVGYSEIDVLGFPLPTFGTINPKKVFFDVAGSQTVVTITSTENVLINAPSNISLSSSAVNAGTSFVTVTGTPLNDIFNGLITFVGVTGNKFIEFEYNASFTSSSNLITFGGSGGIQLLTITSNVALTTSLPSGFSIAPNSLNPGTSIVTVTAPFNPFYRNLSGKIHFSFQVFTRSIDYFQQKNPNQFSPDLLAYEPFDYENGNITLARITGGIGFAGNISLGINGNFNNDVNKFTIRNTPSFFYKSLANIGGFYTGGQFGNNGAHTNFSFDVSNPKILTQLNANNRIGKEGTTQYMSFVISKTAPWRDHEVAVTLYNGNDPQQSSGNAMVKFGYFANSIPANGGPYPIQIRAGNATTFTGQVVTITQDTPNLLVLKIEYGATQHTFTGFINPDPNGIEPMAQLGPVVYTHTANTNGFTKMAVQIGNDNCCYGANNANLGSGVFDEFRLGTSYQSVTPNIDFKISPNISVTTILGNGSTLMFNSTLNSAFSSPTKWTVASTEIGSAIIDENTGLLSITGNLNDVITITGTITLPAVAFSNYILTVVSVPITATSISLMGIPSNKININETEVLAVNYNTPSGVNQFGVSWSSSNSSLATVNNGSVTGLGNGVVTITATYVLQSNIIATRVLTVNVPVTSVSVNGVNTLVVGNTTTLTGTVMPNNATLQTINWTSSNNSIASVNNAGIVNALNVGLVTISATALDNSAIKFDFGIEILPISVTGLTITGNSSRIGLGIVGLTPVFLPANATNKNLNWSSSNTSIATVSGSGVVRGIDFGSVIITAISVSNPAVSASFEVTFLPILVESVSVTGVRAVTVGGTRSLTATVLPANASNKALTWSSSNSAIATVSGSGLVRGLSNGIVTITSVSVSNPTVTGFLVLTVGTLEMPKLSLSVETQLITSVGATLQINASVTGTSNTQVIYSVSDTDIASIDTNGLLKSLKNGIVTVSAQLSADSTITADLIITISGVLNLNNLKADYAYGFYPNPSSDRVYIKLASKVNEIQIYDLLGTVVYSQNTGNSFSINHLQMGQYVLRIVYENGIFVDKLIKK